MIGLEYILNLYNLQLKTYPNIVEGNALRIDWEDVVSKDELDYIMGNPPFVGAKLTTLEQRKDKELVFGSNKYGKLDFVACWFRKSYEFIKNTKIEAALVSTNSIVQGEQVPLLWQELIEDGLVINFAYKTFKWTSEASNKAAVYCVIISFRFCERNIKIIYDEGIISKVNFINAYLLNAPNILIDKLRHPISSKKEMIKGSQLIDGGNFVFTKEEKEEFEKLNAEE